MPSVFALLFPSPADNTVRGSKFPFYFLLLTAIAGTVRSLIHIFAPDGGAGSIAGMDLSVSGANEVIFAFALWGSAQLIYALLQWIVLLRYRSLVPLMWVVQFFETLSRMLVGHLKPVTFAHIPPGQIGNYVFLVLPIAMLALVFWSSRKE